jgi:hypothetical protein
MATRAGFCFFAHLIRYSRRFGQRLRKAAAIRQPAMTYLMRQLLKSSFPFSSRHKGPVAHSVCRSAPRLPLGPSTKDEFLRRAQCLILPVNTAIPAAGAAHALFQLRTHPFNMFPPLFRLLDGDSPTDPLIAGERRKALPCREGSGVRCESSSQICRQTVCHAAGNLARHRCSIY